MPLLPGVLLSSAIDRGWEDTARATYAWPVTDAPPQLGRIFLAQSIVTKTLARLSLDLGHGSRTIAVARYNQQNP
jgi:hypothetical protein